MNVPPPPALPTQLQIARVPAAERPAILKHIKDVRKKCYRHVIDAEEFPGFPTFDDRRYLETIDEIDDLIQFLAILDYREP